MIRLFFSKVALCLILIPSAALCDTQTPQPSSFEMSRNQVIIAVIGAAALFGGFKIAQYLINQSKNYIDQKIEDEIVETITLACTTNGSIEKLPQQEKEAALKKKAWFINVRKRILVKLNTLLNSSTNLLSASHHTVLKATIASAQSIFSLVDLVRSTNPYENDYETPSYVDLAIEDQIIDSILLMSKPNAECTQAELAKKAAGKPRQARIAARLKSKVNKLIIDKILKLVFFA